MPKYDSFLAVVRCIRLWAKKRGLYSNKMGFFGGINCNLLVCFVCQLYPQVRPPGHSPHCLWSQAQQRTSPPGPPGPPRHRTIACAASARLSSAHVYSAR